MSFPNPPLTVLGFIGCRAQPLCPQCGLNSGNSPRQRQEPGKTAWEGRIYFVRPTPLILAAKSPVKLT